MLKSVSALGLLWGLLAPGSPATAIPLSVGHGVECQPVFGQANQVGYGEPGVGNFSQTQRARVFCPLPPHIQVAGGGSYSPGIKWIELLYMDNAREDPFSCYAYAVTDHGGMMWAPTLFTCNVPGGCASSVNSYKGTNTLRWNKPFFWLAFPSYGFSCFLPRAESFASWVTRYSLEW